LWLALPLAAVIARPRLAARIGRSLLQDEGLTPVGLLTKDGADHA
jgi:hypothetical protein